MIRIGHHLFKPKNITHISISDSDKIRICTQCEFPKSWVLSITEIRQNAELSTPEKPVFHEVNVCQQYKTRYKRNLWLIKLFWKLILKILSGKIQKFPTVYYRYYRQPDNVYDIHGNIIYTHEN